MNPSEIFSLTQAEFAKCFSIKQNEPWTEITLPYATLTDKFVRVFVREWPNGTHTVSDCGDLAEDIYEAGSYGFINQPNGGYRALNIAHVLSSSLLKDSGISSFTDHKGQRFVKFVKEASMLVTAIFDMALLIQSAVSIAAMDAHRSDSYGK